MILHFRAYSRTNKDSEEVLRCVHLIGNWDTNAEFIRTCGECEDFGPDGCKSSYIEAKYGSRNTPACEDFKLMFK